MDCSDDGNQRIEIATRLDAQQVNGARVTLKS